MCAYEAARRRARALLRAHLSPAQREELERWAAFSVVAQSGRRYRITSVAPFNVRDEAAGNDYCLQFGYESSGVPIEDLMLAEKLLLECDEAAFLATANERPGAGAAKC